MAARIDRVGELGDGLGVSEDGRKVCVPFTLPGEHVTLRPAGLRGSLTLGTVVALLAESEDRAAPACGHFGTCGGCALQHWRPPAYAGWKAERLHRALVGAGFADPPLHPLVAAAPSQRRRMGFAFRRVGDRCLLGLHVAGSRDIVDVRECPVLHPGLQALLAPLRRLLADTTAADDRGSVAINLLDTGPDLLVRARTLPGVAARQAITAFARAHRLPRIHWAREDDEPEPICLIAPATIAFAGVAVTPPPDAFLQATTAGEAAIVAAVLDLLPARPAPSARLVELYAGCGTLTFALAARGPVVAYEGNAAAERALRAAAQLAMPGRIDCHRRDLARQPLQPPELTQAAAVILDPPWAGAAAQVAALAKSAVRRVIYVSCNPAALQRDAALLQAASFRLLAATPIDQFLWSSQIEAVVGFAR